MEEKEKSILIPLELSAAFDTVDQVILSDGLKHYTFYPLSSSAGFPFHFCFPVILYVTLGTLDFVLTLMLPRQ